jgi:type III pantothenate kinase
MFLGIDIGNSDIVLAFCVNNKWSKRLRLPSKSSENVVYYISKFKDFLVDNNLKSHQIKHIGISSVVPKLNSVITDAVEQVFGVFPKLLGPDFFSKIPLKILNPSQIGSDLICNAMYAFHNYKKNAVVLDFGTAFTCTTVSGSGEILGVSIAPGLYTAIKSLFIHTAQLPEVPIELPTSVLGKDTIHAIQAGVLWGYVGMANKLIEKIKAELNLQELIVITTGGLNEILSKEINFVTESSELVTLEGLRLLLEP